MGAFSGKSKLKIFQGGTKIKRAYLGTANIYSSGNTVTYVVDSGIMYNEEVEEGVSVLAPSSFTPAKSGWNFVGWREDTEANGNVLESKLMGDQPVTLYAVFQQYITLSYNGNGASGGSVGSQGSYRYYNNENYKEAAFVLADNSFTKTDYAFTGWDLGQAGERITLSASSVAYAQWKQTTKYIFKNGVTADYTGGWSAESGSYFNRDTDTAISVGKTIRAGIGTGGSEEGENRTSWLTSGTIDFSEFKTITINAANWIVRDAGNCEIAYYIGNTLLRSFAAENVSGTPTSFTANISGISSGKLRVKFHVEDGSDYYSCSTIATIYSIALKA